MIPVGRFLILGIRMSVYALARRRFIQRQFKRVFRNPALEARAGDGAALEQSGLIVAGPPVTACARFADVAGQENRQECRAIGLGGVEPVIDAFALVNRHGPPDCVTSQMSLAIRSINSAGEWVTSATLSRS